MKPFEFTINSVPVFAIHSISGKMGSKFQGFYHYLHYRILLRLLFKGCLKFVTYIIVLNNTHIFFDISQWKSLKSWLNKCTYHLKGRHVSGWCMVERSKRSRSWEELERLQVTSRGGDIFSFLPYNSSPLFDAISLWLSYLLKNFCRGQPFWYHCMATLKGSRQGRLPIKSCGKAAAKCERISFWR